MGVTETQMKEIGYSQRFSDVETTMKMILGAFESLIVTDTYQYDDYSKLTGRVSSAIVPISAATLEDILFDNFSPVSR